MPPTLPPAETTPAGVAVSDVAPARAHAGALPPEAVLSPGGAGAPASVVSRPLERCETGPVFSAELAVLFEQEEQRVECERQQREQHRLARLRETARFD